MITFKEFFEESNTDLPLAPAVFIGWQHDLAGNKFALFNLTQPIADRCVGTTLAQITLQKAGYYVPPIPENTPRDTPLEQLDDRVKKEARTKDNPFGYKQKDKLKPAKLPRKAFHQKLPAKNTKRDLLKPRKWTVNSLGSLIRRYL